MARAALPVAILWFERCCPPLQTGTALLAFFILLFVLVMDNLYGEFQLNCENTALQVYATLQEMWGCKPDEWLLADWSQVWRGWAELCDVIVDRPVEQAEENRMDECFDVVAETVSRFVWIAAANADVPMQTDPERISQLLREENLKKHEASGAGNNCLAHSLLKVLLHERFFPPMTAAEELELCEKNRRALVRHADERLRPRVRDANNSIVAGARHEAAFLQHDLHAAPTVQFFSNNVECLSLSVVCALRCSPGLILLYFRR